jgi:hypothetical protein
MQNSLVNYPSREDYSYARTNDGVELTNPREMHHNQQQQQQATEGSYSSPASTISLHGTPHSRDLAMPISTSSELAFALESKPTDLTPGSRQKSYTAFGDHQNQLPTGAATANSHPDAHGVVDRTATDHDEADFYSQQEADRTQSTESRVYQQETDCTAFKLNTHGHYIPSPYSSLSDAYPGSTDHQIDYGHCVGGGVGYSPSVYGETLSSVLGHIGSNGVIQPVEPFASYST